MILFSQKLSAPCSISERESRMKEHIICLISGFTTTMLPYRVLSLVGAFTPSRPV